MMTPRHNFHFHLGSIPPLQFVHLQELLWGSPRSSPHPSIMHPQSHWTDALRFQSFRVLPTMQNLSPPLQFVHLKELLWGSLSSPHPPIMLLPNHWTDALPFQLFRILPTTQNLCLPSHVTNVNHMTSWNHVLHLTALKYDVPDVLPHSFEKIKLMT